VNLIDTAQEFAAHGASVVPARSDGTKAPAAFWKQYQQRRATPDEINNWLTSGTYDGVGLVCGAVSGNLEMLELEGRAVTENYVERLQDVLISHDLGDVWARLWAGYTEQTPGGGLHWLYRVDGAAARNLKLARRPATEAELVDKPAEKVKVLIETRGEGGYVVVAPSAGRTHDTGKAWKVIAGSIATIPTLSEDERDALHALATTLDQMPIETDEPQKTSQNHKSTSDTSERPGDDYNARADWAELLDGWTKVRPVGNGWAWRRPGKDRGISATTGTSDDGADRLYVFSTSTEFDAERPYSKFAAYAHLNHGGDYRAAAKQLRRDGYGTSPPPSSPLRLIHNSDGGAEPKTNGSSALAPDMESQPDAGLTDVGNAHLLVAEHAHHIHYVPERGRWLSWSGHHWIWDDAGTVIEYAKQTILALDTVDENVWKHQKRSLSRRAIEAMVALARTDPGICVHFTDLDAQPYALCTPGGVVDLRTGKTNPARPEDLHTRTTRIASDPDCPTPLWDRFLKQTFGGDAELIGFVQRLAGYSASGIVSRHVLPFLHGPGGNGKSVFLDVLRMLLGDYAGAAPAKFLMAGQQQHETEVARLAGLRLVICSEVNQDDRFDEAKTKLLTGGDALTARFMRQDHFTFEPTHHLWLMGNHQPKVSGGGESFWRRLRMVPFTYTVPPESKIEGLAQILIDQEGPGILNWVVNGAVLSQSGLEEPEIVMSATRTYASEEDALARFIADRIHLGGGREVRIDTAVLRRSYEEWCRDEGEKPVPPQVLGRELRTRYDVEQLRSNGRRFYIGMTLLASEGDDEQPPHWSDR
jgi:P4 family phage/plasmid primase-like protien